MPQPAAIAVPSTDGVTVVAHDHGGEGPPLVLCHATGFHGRYWDPVCAALADDYRCIALDLRGHGDSTIPDGLDLDWRGMGEDVVSVLDAFELRSVRAAGHSMGGCSLVMAELARPGTIDRGWLFEPIIIPPNFDEMFVRTDDSLADRARRRRDVFESRDAAYERYASRPPFSEVDPAALRAYVDHAFADRPDGRVALKCPGEREAQVFEHSHTDVFERLGKVQSRLTVAGSGDGEPPAVIAPTVAAELPDGTFERYDDLTHFAPMEAPARIADAIRRAVR